ncbi:hypothetical protein CDAR_215271 [Caerostris darwini]|uniref:Uncharacterized protein n=1 Tax=Caerostris darwini TaxID=1538125 RepID=A0AAV4U7I7_9ARAC|nr:hypothetical protein CDAR_215271 [Caerostris darwini]
MRSSSNGPDTFLVQWKDQTLTNGQRSDKVTTTMQSPPPLQLDAPTGLSIFPKGQRTLFSVAWNPHKTSVPTGGWWTS